MRSCALDTSALLRADVAVQEFGFRVFPTRPGDRSPRRTRVARRRPWDAGRRERAPAEPCGDPVEGDGSGAGDVPRLAPFTTAERDLIRREMGPHFGQLPSLADGLLLRTWRGGPQQGEPKLPPAVRSP
jgi:hypothetical protein